MCGWRISEAACPSTPEACRRSADDQVLQFLPYPEPGTRASLPRMWRQVFRHSHAHLRLRQHAPRSGRDRLAPAWAARITREVSRSCSGARRAQAQDQALDPCRGRRRQAGCARRVGRGGRAGGAGRACGPMGPGDRPMDRAGGESAGSAWTAGGAVDAATGRRGPRDLGGRRARRTRHRSRAHRRPASGRCARHRAGRSGCGEPLALTFRCLPAPGPRGFGARPARSRGPAAPCRRASRA